MFFFVCFLCFRPEKVGDFFFQADVPQTTQDVSRQGAMVQDGNGTGKSRQQEP